MSKFSLHDRVRVKGTDTVFEVKLISFDMHTGTYSYSKMGRGAKYYQEKELELVRKGKKKC